MDSFTKYEHLQIEEVCRLCLTKKEQMQMICDAGLADMLLECASIQVSPENGLYNLVCNHCANEVSRWYIFKQQVVRSFEVAQWLLNRNSRNTDISDLSNASYKCSVNQDEESLSSIIEDPDELEKLLNEYAPEI